MIDRKPAARRFDIAHEILRSRGISSYRPKSQFDFFWLQFSRRENIIPREKKTTKKLFPFFDKYRHLFTLFICKINHNRLLVDKLEEKITKLTRNQRIARENRANRRNGDESEMASDSEMASEEKFSPQEILYPVEKISW